MGDFDIYPEGFDCSIFKNPHASSMSLSVLVCIEMFNTFNALSENQSLLSVPPWDNIWVVLAVFLSIALHSVILYIPWLAEIFKTAPANYDEWVAVLLISFPVILFDEMLKLISRRYAASQSKAIDSAKKTS